MKKNSFLKNFSAFFLFIFLLSNPSFAAVARGYEDLLSALRVEQSSPQDLVAASWKMGKLMEEDASAHKLWAGYREEINKRLALDLGVRENEIRDMRQFARVYPELPSPELGWAHYLILIYVHPVEKREALREQALHGHWPKETLRLEVNKLHEAEKEITKTEKGFSKIPGKLNIYRVVKAQSGVNTGRKVLDLGFGMQKLLGENMALVEGDFTEDALHPVPASPEDLFIYRAVITEIKDGDTFEATVDLGFGLSVNQTFRLNGVDTPELDRAEGFTAKTFVYNTIMRAEGKVVLRAGQPDKYNRILAEVWVGNESLNQKLLDQHQAVAVRE